MLRIISGLDSSRCFFSRGFFLGWMLTQEILFYGNFIGILSRRFCRASILNNHLKLLNNDEQCDDKRDSLKNRQQNLLSKYEHPIIEMSTFQNHTSQRFQDLRPKWRERQSGRNANNVQNRKHESLDKQKDKFYN